MTPKSLLVLSVSKRNVPTVDVPNDVVLDTLKRFHHHYTTHRFREKNKPEILIDHPSDVLIFLLLRGIVVGTVSHGSITTLKLSLSCSTLLSSILYVN